MKGISSNVIDDSMVLKSRLTSGIPRGISGKIFVLPFVAILIVLCILMISVAIRFQTIMARLEESRSLWPQASQELRPRYDQIEASVASSLTGEPKKAQWEASNLEFRSSTLFDRQASASMEMENQILHATAHPKDLNSIPFDSNLPGVLKLIEAERRRRDSQAGFIGWLTVSALRLRLPAIYDPLSIK